MPANKFTIKAVEAILACDMGVSAIVRENVTKALAKDVDADYSCGETEAAKILDISQSTLYNWRKGKWQRQPHPFWFRVWYNLANEPRYDRTQLRGYMALLRARATIADAQPDITEKEVESFISLAETGK